MRPPLPLRPQPERCLRPLAVGVGLLIAAAVMAGSALVPARAATCPVPDQAVDVQFDTSFDTARIDHARSKAQIQAMYLESQGRATIPNGGAAVGLTVTHSEFSFNTSTQLYRREDGLYCVYLRTIKAHLNQNDTIVYIAREFPKSSCAYDVTYEHEKRHVAVYYFTQKDFAPRIEAALGRLAAAAKPRVVRSREAGRTLHATEIHAALSELLGAMEEERRARNAALDTEANYERERAKCASW